MEDVSVEILDNFWENQGSKGKKPRQEMKDLQNDISVQILNGDAPIGKRRRTRASCRLMYESKQTQTVKREESKERTAGHSKQNIKSQKH